MENKNIIRKLARQEVLYDNEVHHNNLVLTRVFLIQVAPQRHQLFTLDLIKQACTFWIKRHPLLRAEIQRSTQEGQDYERFFVYMDEARAFKLNNVELLEETEDIKWINVMDKDKATLFDMSTGPMWRLKFIKLRDTDTLGYNYAFLLTTQHPIGDGRNCYEIGVQLLNIVGALLDGRQCAEMDESVVEHPLFNVDDLLEQKQIPFEHENIELDEENRESVKLVNYEAENPDFGFQRFCLPTDKSRLLKDKVKANSSAKMSSVLLTVISAAFKSLYIRHGVDDIPLNKFQYFLLASTREKLGLSNTQMGVYSSLLHLATEISDADFETIVKNGNFAPFWAICNARSASLDAKLKRSEEFTFYHEIEPIVEQLKDISKYDEKSLTFILSNIGLMKNTDCSSVVRVREHYVRQPNIKCRIGWSLFIGATTVDGNMCFGFSYNECKNSTSFISELIDEIDRIIGMIIASN
jgi:hypothetical protein